MKTFFKRSLLLVLSFVLILSGCANEKKASTALNNDGASLTHKITDEPLELTILQKKPAREENIFTEAFKKTNVNLKFELGENNTDFDQAVTLAMASKQLSDILYNHKVENFMDYGMSGVIIPLNDLIDKHAPNIKKFLEENPDVAQYITAGDGNIYYVPFIQELQTANGWFIREDWLNNLGLKIPDTLDEFYDTMVAIKNQDPNKNGKKDEVPYFTAKTKVLDVVRDFEGLFDASVSFRYNGDKVSYGPFEPQFKNMIKTLAQWYKEGLLDEELFTRKSQKEYFLGNNLGGITHDWFASTSGYNTTFGKSIDGFRFVPFAPPENVNGERVETTKRSKFGGEGWAITANCKNPVEAIKYFDFWWTEEGKITANYGVEGVTYNMVDGVPKYTEEFLASTDPAPMNLRYEYRTNMNFGVINMASFELDLMNPIGREGMEMYINNGYLSRQIVKLRYTEEEQDSITKYKGQVETHLSEMIQKWLLGQSDIEEDYDLFVKEMKSFGADKYIQVEQQAYERFLN